MAWDMDLGIKTPIMDEQGLYDIYGHWHVPFWQTNFFKISIISLVCLALLVALYFCIKKYSKKTSLSPQQKALYALEALAKKTIYTRDDAHDTYFALTDILKNFFQAHYGMPFASMTDLEMLQILKKIPFSHDLLAPLQDLVHAGLGVKYAHQDALHTDFQHNVTVGISLINHIASSNSKEK
jgi:hypothetical protein